MTTQFEPSSTVLICPESSLSCDGQIIKLKHPKSNQTCLAYLNLESKSIKELLYTKEKYVSWFVGESVVGNSPLSIGTPLDPLFMILPYLVISNEKYSPLSQILVDSKFPSAVHLDELVPETALVQVADVKPSLDKIVKFNKEKTLKWLSRKVKNVASAMKKCGVEPGFNSSLSDDEYTKYACGIVSDYISSSLSSDLQEKLGVQLSVDSDELEKPAKRPKLNDSLDHEACKPAKKTLPKGKEKAQKLTKAQKDLANVNTKGMKTMSSFFKKVEK